MMISQLESAIRLARTQVAIEDSGARPKEVERVLDRLRLLRTASAPTRPASTPPIRARHHPGANCTFSRARAEERKDGGSGGNETKSEREGAAGGAASPRRGVPAKQSAARIPEEVRARARGYVFTEPRAGSRGRRDFRSVNGTPARRAHRMAEACACSAPATATAGSAAS